MIYELNPSQFKTISHLLDGDSIHRDVYAVVEGERPGWVFVDNVMEPHTAMIWSEKNRGFYFIGATDSMDFNSYLGIYLNYIIEPRARMMSLESFEMIGTTKEWNSTLDKVFASRSKNNQNHYEYELFEL